MLLFVLRKKDRPAKVLVVCLLLMTGFGPRSGDASESLRCYSCDGGPACNNPGYPDASVAKQCDSGTKACFKSGGIGSPMVRGCAPKFLTDFAEKHIRDMSEAGNLFDCGGGPVSRTFTRLCNHFGEGLVIKPWMLHLFTDLGGTYLCKENFCNGGGPLAWIIPVGNWGWGKCQAMTIDDILFQAKHAILMRDDPEYAREMEKIREVCTWDLYGWIWKMQVLVSAIFLVGVTALLVRLN